MNRGIIIVLIILVLVIIAGGGYYMFNNINQSNENTNNTPNNIAPKENEAISDSNVLNTTNETATSNNKQYFVEDVTLNSGYKMPVLGIGTFQLSTSEAENSTYWALKAGFRLIDTAKIYGNETGVGKGIQRAIDEGVVAREEIFVTTKMWTSDYGNPDEAIDSSLERLGLDYIDLMILHHSQDPSDIIAYKGMERAVAEGKLRSIGLSNYYDGEDFDRVVNATTIKPALLQNETHPYHQSRDMAEHIKKYGTVLESWYPLGGRGHTQELFNDLCISSIAKAHDKSSAQVLIRWHLQMGYIAIPGSSNEKHIQEDYDVFDFELSNEEMEQIKAIDKNQRNSTY